MFSTHSKNWTRRRVVLILTVTGLLGTAALKLTAPASAQTIAPSWRYTGSLNTQRSGHTATLLSNGKVLVVGGGDGVTTSAELYDPATGTWSLTGTLNVARESHTATLLPNG